DNGQHGSNRIEMCTQTQAESPFVARSRITQQRGHQSMATFMDDDSHQERNDDHECQYDIDDWLYIHACPHIRAAFAGRPTVLFPYLHMQNGCFQIACEPVPPSHLTCCHHMLAHDERGSMFARAPYALPPLPSQ